MTSFLACLLVCKFKSHLVSVVEFFVFVFSIFPMVSRIFSRSRGINKYFYKLWGLNAKLEKKLTYLPEFFVFMFPQDQY